MLTSLALFPQLQELPTECIYAFLLLSPQMLNDNNMYDCIWNIVINRSPLVMNTSKLIYTIIMRSDKGETLHK